MLIDIILWVLSIFIFVIGVSILHINPLYSLSLWIISGLLIVRAFEVEIEGELLRFIAITSVLSFVLGMLLKIMNQYSIIISIGAIISYGGASFRFLKDKDLITTALLYAIPLSISLILLVISAIISVFIFILIITVMMVLRSNERRKNKFYPFPDRFGKAITDINPEGYVRVFGEIWIAESPSWKISKGEDIYVKELKGYKVIVLPVLKCPACGSKYPITDVPQKCKVCGMDLTEVVFNFFKEHTKKKIA